VQEKKKERKENLERKRKKKSSFMNPFFILDCRREAKNTAGIVGDWLVTTPSTLAIALLGRLTGSLLTGLVVRAWTGRGIPVVSITRTIGLVPKPGLLAATNPLRCRIRVSTVARIHRTPHPLTEPGVTVSRERLPPALLRPGRKNNAVRKTTSPTGQVRSLSGRISERHHSGAVAIHAHRRRRSNHDRRRPIAPLSSGVGPGTTEGNSIRRVSLEPQIPLVSALENRIHEVHTRKLIADCCLR